MVKLTGNEKAFIGGLLAFVSTTIVQLQAQSGGYTLKNLAWSVGSWIVVHLGVWLATNTPSGTSGTPPTITVTPTTPTTTTTSSAISTTL